MRIALMCQLCLLAARATGARAQAPEETTLAVPALSLTFSSTWVAEELGLWEREGLKVKLSIVAGVGAANAVLAGSVDFAVPTAATLVRASTRGQQLVAIAQLMDHMPIETRWGSSRVWPW
jgi:ABC-type nitrate/sulfonate/bicarbonate transport system substrate-binding protein